jgi:hypothetical protein
LLTRAICSHWYLKSFTPCLINSSSAGKNLLLFRERTWSAVSGCAGTACCRERASSAFSSAICWVRFFSTAAICS